MTQKQVIILAHLKKDWSEPGGLVPGSMHGQGLIKMSENENTLDWLLKGYIERNGPLDPVDTLAFALLKKTVRELK